MTTISPDILRSAAKAILAGKGASYPVIISIRRVLLINGDEFLAKQLLDYALRMN